VLNASIIARRTKTNHSTRGFLIDLYENHNNLSSFRGFHR